MKNKWNAASAIPTMSRLQDLEAIEPKLQIRKAIRSRFCFATGRPKNSRVRQVVAVLGAVTTAVSIAAPASAMDLKTYLQAVQRKHGGLQALDASIEAAEDRRQAGDLELVPSLVANASKIDDKKFPNQFFQYGGTQTKTTSYSLGLNKKFSSGTSVGLSASTVEIENPGVSFGVLPVPPGFYLDRFATGSLGVSLSQSLWRDFFGSGTRLRHEREIQMAAAEKGQYDLQKKQLLIAAEAAFWDFMYSTKDVELTQSSLERAQRIENWVRRRTYDGISDNADYLQAQALVAQRKLQLINSQDTQLTAQKNVRDFLELEPSETLPSIEGNLAKQRPLNDHLTPGVRVLQIEAYLASLQAKARAAQSREVDDSQRPDLVLLGSYNTNSYDQTMGQAVKRWNETDKPTTMIGLRMTYLFDTDVKGAALSASRKDALAAKLLSERKMLESASAWSELNRRYEELSRKISATESISNLQTKRARAELDKYNKGRSITTNVVDSEQQAAEAELALTRLLAEQRKLEAQGRLFVSLDANEDADNKSNRARAEGDSK